MRSFSTRDFDFDLPPELVAQHPAAERSASRLLDGTGPEPRDRIFRDLPTLLRAGDLLVFNDTRVIKARLLGVKATGGQVEALVERVLPNHEVLMHLRASKSPKLGQRVRFGSSVADAMDTDPQRGFDAEVLGRGGPDDGLFHLRFPGDPLALLEALAGLSPGCAVVLATAELLHPQAARPAVVGAAALPAAQLVVLPPLPLDRLLFLRHQGKYLSS